jgi:hypothetical protein
MIDPSMGMQALNFDMGAGNPNSYSSSPANVDFSSPAVSTDYSTVGSIGIDPSSVTDSPAMAEDPLASLGLADGGEVATKKPSVLGTSQFNQINAATNAGQSTSNNPEATASSGSASNVLGGTTISADGKVVYGGGGNGDSSAGGYNSGFSSDARGIVGTAGTVARTLGTITSNPGLSQVGSVLGIAGSANPALSAGLTAANMATHGLAGAAFGLANAKSLGSVMDIAATIANPMIGVANSALGLAGLNSLGTAAENAYGSLSVDGPTSVSDAFNPMTQNILTQQQDVMDNAPIDSPGTAAQAAVASDMPGDSLSNMMGITDSFGTSHGGGAGFNGGGDRGPGGSSGEAGAAAGGASASGPGEADGDLIHAPGDGTTDTKLVPLANGEYVLPADVVNAIGVDKLDALKDKYHVPVAVQRLQKFARG